MDTTGCCGMLFNTPATDPHFLLLQRAAACCLPWVLGRSNKEAMDRDVHGDGRHGVRRRPTWSPSACLIARAAAWVSTFQSLGA